MSEKMLYLSWSLAILENNISILENLYIDRIKNYREFKRLLDYSKVLFFYTDQLIKKDQFSEAISDELDKLEIETANFIAKEYK